MERFTFSSKGWSKLSIERHEPRLLFAVLLVSLCVKMGLWAYIDWKNPNGFLAQDSQSYIAPARALLHTGKYATSLQTPDEPETGRTPGYPVFLAAVFAIFGERFTVVPLAQILLSLGVLYFVFKLGNEIWANRTIALWASILLSFDIISLSHSLILLSETLFTFLICILLLAAIRFAQTHKISWILITGIVLALATFVRPVSYYLFLPMLFGLLALVRHMKWDWIRTTKAMAYLLLPVFISIGGWQLRNYSQTGSAQFSVFQGFNMLFHFGADIVAMRDGIELQEARKRLGFKDWNWEAYSEGNSESLAVTIAKLSDQWKAEGTKIILAHPALFLKSELYGIARMLIPPGEGPFVRMLGVPIGKTKSVFDLSRLRYPFALGAFLFAMIYLIIIYLGVFLWFRFTSMHAKLKPFHILLWLTFLYFPLISLGPGTYSRYRVPVMPILALYASAGLVELFAKKKRPLAKTEPSPVLLNE